MPNTKQLFFIQRLLELFHRETIDSYRVRVLNPILALQELSEVYDDLLEGKIKRFEDLQYCIEETITLLKKDSTIEFHTIDKTFFIDSILKKIKKETFPEQYAESRSAIKTILRDNVDYAVGVIRLLTDVFNQPDKEDPFPEFNKVDGLAGILATELLRVGFTKSFLYSFCYSTFQQRTEGFNKDFAKLTDLFKSPGIEYLVWFKVYSPRVTPEEWPQIPSFKIMKEIPDLNRLPAKITNFLIEKRNHFFIGQTIKAPDHFAALQKAKQYLSEAFDVIGLAHHNRRIELQPNAIVYPIDRLELAGLPQIKFIPDGKFPDGEGVLRMLQDKMPQILNNTNIRPGTKEKIKSAVRYLRYGHEAIEIEHQLINYWIGLEYLYSNEHDSTFTRLKAYFPNLQVLVYLRRNLQEFLNEINDKELAVQIQGFIPNNISCLLRDECLDSIRDNIYEAYPLLSYRAWKLKNKVLKKGIKEYLNRHREHLEWHLARIYRERNKIVHEAKYGFINQTLASNLRYYLAFSLSMIMDYFSRENVDARDLQEYFALQQLRLNSLEHQGFPPEKMIAIEHDFSFLA